MKHPAKTDIAVLLLFFNRPKHFQGVFDVVKEARPAKLFLYQDGPRNEKDLVGIEACRNIVSDNNIDWECEVHRSYQQKNQGCDPSEYLSQKWAFSFVEKCIVLEDDDVPSLSFFPFCKEMLDRYENDERIAMICGFNEDEITPDCNDSYFFTSIFAIWGWASWRRVIDKWDAEYSFLDDSQAVHRLESIVRQRGYIKKFIKICRDHKAAGKEYYESIFWSTMLLNSSLAIMPAKNMINNYGFSDDSTHFAGGSLKTMPKAYRKIFTMGRYDLDFPLRHPRYIIENVDYKERLYKTNAWGHPMIKLSRSFEELFLNLRYGNFGFISKSLKRRINKWLGKDKHV